MTSSAQDIEPLLARGIRHGFRAADELAVDNRKLVLALEGHCGRLGVQWSGPVDGLKDAHHGVDTVVIANGIDAPSLWPGLPVRPVKGEWCGCGGEVAVCPCRNGGAGPCARTAAISGAACRRCCCRRDPV